jgi:hypothetical protein
MRIDRIRNTLGRFIEDTNERQVLDAYQATNPNVTRQSLALRRDAAHQELDRVMLDRGDVLFRYPGEAHLTEVDPFAGLNPPGAIRSSGSVVEIPTDVIGRLGLGREFRNE